MKSRTLKYWSAVIRRAFAEATAVSGMKIALLACVVALGLLLVLAGSGAFDEWQALIATSVIGTLVVALVIWPVIFVARLVRTPAAIDQERHAEVENLERRVTELSQGRTGRLELSYEEGNRSSRQDWPDVAVVHRVTLRNAGNVQVKDIRVRLEETRPSVYGNLPIDLHFMNDAVGLLNPAEANLIDVVQVNLANDGTLFFYTNNSDWRYPVPYQDFDLRISASGSDTPLTERWFRLSTIDLSDGLRFVLSEVE